ncbi:MAG: hypothetical protein AVDCRST_MAG79-2290, partial [uncultured Thermoleophilia bacterium]
GRAVPGEGRRGRLAGAGGLGRRSADPRRERRRAVPV